MKLAMSKKSVENWGPDTFIFWLITGIGLAFTAIFLLFFFSKTGSAQTEVQKGIETDFILQRFLDSSSCFAYESEGIMLKNSIDLNKFNEDTLNACYYIENEKMPAFHLILNGPEIPSIQSISTKNWLSNAGFQRKTIPYKVKIYTDPEKYEGEIEIEIQNEK